MKKEIERTGYGLTHDEASKMMFFGKTFLRLSDVEKRVIVSKIGDYVPDAPRELELEKEEDTLELEDLGLEDLD